MLISIVLIVFVYQIIIFQFESSASNADTYRFNTGTTMDDQNVKQDDDFIKSNSISFDNVSNASDTSFDNKPENSIQSIMYSQLLLQPLNLLSSPLIQILQLISNLILPLIPFSQIS